MKVTHRILKPDTGNCDVKMSISSKVINHIAVVVTVKIMST